MKRHGWQKTKLGKHCEIVSGFPFKSDSFSDDPDDVVLVKGENVGQGQILWEISKRWSRADLIDLDRFRLIAGDVVLAMDRPWVPAGLKFARIPESAPEALLVQRVARLRASNGLIQDFLACLIGSSSFVAYIQNIARGVGVPHISGKEIAAFEFEMPLEEEQRRIASIISTYDDLIENNRRRMVLLEESARLLYREWFVRLRFPGHESTRIVNGVPEGWECVPLEKVAEFRLGKMLDQVKNKGDQMPYLANINVRWGEVDLSGLREMRFKENELEVFGLKFGDIVMCEGGEPGRCAIWKDQLPGMMFQKAIHRIRCRENMEYVYLYRNLRYQGQAGHLASLFTGATIKHLPREKLAKVTVTVPPKQLLELFAEHVVPIETQLGRLEAMNRQASKARDLLLPKLMSGEIEV